MTTIALTIADSDSGGGAGGQADLKIFSALGVYGARVLAAVTVQNTGAVTAIQSLSPAIISDQTEAVFDALDVKAVKIGMLGDPEAIATLARATRGRAVPVMLDPVMMAKSGDWLLAAKATAALPEHLLPLAPVLTPNLAEAADLPGKAPARDRASLLPHGAAPRALRPDRVLMKGGHAEGAICTDLLIGPRPQDYTAPRIATRDTHGADMRRLHGYLQNAIAATDRLAVGSGHGPVHHFHAWRHDGERPA